MGAKWSFEHTRSCRWTRLLLSLLLLAMLLAGDNSDEVGDVLDVVYSIPWLRERVLVRSLA